MEKHSFIKLLSMYFAPCCYCCCFIVGLVWCDGVWLGFWITFFFYTFFDKKNHFSYVLHELDHGDKIKDLPENLALSGLCSGMIEAWKLLKKPSSVILFLIEDVSYNICDQRFHEFYIRTNHPEVKVIRRTLTEISKRGKLGPNGELIV